MHIDDFIERHIVKPNERVIHMLREVDHRLIYRFDVEVDYALLFDKIGRVASLATLFCVLNWFAENSHQGSFEVLLRDLPRFDEFGHYDFGAIVATQSGSNHPRSQLLRSLRLFQFILDKKTRERAFQPAFEDLKQQFVESRRYRTKWAKRWIHFCFGFRAALLITDCVRIMLLDRILRPFAKIVPNEVKRWWLS